jgi:hypothetical protein
LHIAHRVSVREDLKAGMLFPASTWRAPTGAGALYGTGGGGWWRGPKDEAPIGGSVQPPCPARNRACAERTPARPTGALCAPQNPCGRGRALSGCALRTHGARDRLPYALLARDRLPCKWSVVVCSCACFVWSMHAPNLGKRATTLSDANAQMRLRISNRQEGYSLFLVVSQDPDRALPPRASPAALVLVCDSVQPPSPVRPVLRVGIGRYYSDSGYAIIYTPDHPEGVIVSDPTASCLPGTGIPCFSSAVAFM